MQINNIACLYFILNIFFFLNELFIFLSSLQISTEMSKRRLCQCRMQMYMSDGIYWDHLWNNHHRPWFVVFVTCAFVIICVYSSKAVLNNATPHSHSGTWSNLSGLFENYWSGHLYAQLNGQMESLRVFFS